jgi:hypothetical protein
MFITATETNNYKGHKNDIPDKSAITRLIIYAVFIQYFRNTFLSKHTNAVILPISETTNVATYRTVKRIEVVSVKYFECDPNISIIRLDELIGQKKRLIFVSPLPFILFNGSCLDVK